MKLLGKTLERNSSKRSWECGYNYFMCENVSNELWPDQANRLNARFIVRDRPIKERGERRVEINEDHILISGKRYVARTYAGMHVAMYNLVNYFERKGVTEVWVQMI